MSYLDDTGDTQMLRELVRTTKACQQASDLLRARMLTLSTLIYDAARMAALEIDPTTETLTLDGVVLPYNSANKFLALAINQGASYLCLEYDPTGEDDVVLLLYYSGGMGSNVPRIKLLRVENGLQYAGLTLIFKNGHQTPLLFDLSDKGICIFPDKNAKEAVLLTPSLLAAYLLGD